MNFLPGPTHKVPKHIEDELILGAELDKAKARIAELKEALRYMIEDIDHEDHDKGDWSWQVVVRNARRVLDDD